MLVHLDEYTSLLQNLGYSQWRRFMLWSELWYCVLCSTQYDPL